MPTIDQQMDKLVECISGHPIELAQRLVEWTAASTDSIPTCDDLGSSVSKSLRISEKSLLLPYMNFIRPSKWYHQLLTAAITSITSRLSPGKTSNISSNTLASTAVMTWCLPSPSIGYQCRCQDCKTLHSFLQSLDAKYRFQAALIRRQHVERILTKEYGHDYLSFETLRQGSPHTLILKKKAVCADMLQIHFMWDVIRGVYVPVLCQTDCFQVRCANTLHL
jgi:hypothetical protein